MINGSKALRGRLSSMTALFLVLLALTAIVQIIPDAMAASLKQGSRGEQVKVVQDKLKRWGYYDGAVDGIFGPKTTEAVKYFQRKNGLTQDGVVGPKTMEKLGMQASSASSGGGSNRDNDLELLSRMISAEGRGEPYKGQVAIGAVIMNRIKHPSFPNSLSGVLFQKGAFSAVDDGQFNEPIADISRKAAVEAYNGADPTGGCVYYYNPKKTSNKFMLSLPIALTIGNHVFCRYEE